MAKEVGFKDGEPAHVCARAGCDEPASRGARYCDEHREQYA